MDECLREFDYWHMKDHTRYVLLLVLDKEARIKNTDFKISIECIKLVAFYQHEIQIFFFFYIKTVWTYNSPTLQFTHLKYIVEFLVYSQCCVTIITIN